MKPIEAGDAVFNKLIIFDLDETLLHGSEYDLERPPDLNIGYYSVYVRPFAAELISFCFKRFAHVALWTSATESYAEEACHFLFRQNKKRLQFIWSRDRCTKKFNPENFEWEWIKDLNKVKRRGFKLEQIIMVDNTPSKLRRQYGNLVRVKDFVGTLPDNELELLMAYLPSLGGAENVRNIEKRGWQKNTTP